MDKNVLKKFAIESRQELMDKIKNKIKTFFIDEDFNSEQKGEIYILSNEKHSLSLTNEEFKKRELLIKRVKELSLEQVIEEAAYTWFNRIIAIRYMEINDMLPLTKNNQSLGIRVLSSRDNTPDPEILKFTNLMNPDLDIDFKKEKFVELKDENEKFKYVLLLICKKLGKVIPQVFDGITDYIDILIPDNLLNDTGFVTKIVNDVNEYNFKEVEIIGWLYQYYISEKKDEAFKNLKNKIKLDKNSIPAATQLFTPDWIVKYMVENTLGKLWTNSTTANSIESELTFYVKNNGEKLKKKFDDPKDIKVIDPCSGSGHILLYMFELLFKIYESVGYKKNDIPECIIRNNLYGLDIDDRAGQLSILTVLLKAREYDKDIFNKKLKLNVYSIQESNLLSRESLNLIREEKNDELNDIIDYTYNLFFDAKEYGSIIKVEKKNYAIIYDKVEQLKKSNLDIFEYQQLIELEQKFIPLVNQAIVMSNKYNAVVTNPPYMGNKGMNNKLLEYTKKNYNNYKFDMFSVFIKRASDLTETGCYYALVTQPSILFLSSFEQLRSYILSNETINSVLHMGRGIFGVDFGSTAFVIQKEKYNDFLGKYFKLHDRTFQYIDCDDIKKIFLGTLKNENYTFNFADYVYLNNEVDNKEENDIDITNKSQKILYCKNQKLFQNIPTQPFAYWLSDKMINLFATKKVEDKYTAKQGIITADTNRFLRKWTEIDFKKIGWNYNNKQEAKESGKKWFPYNKGGNYRKWYGNNEYLINWYNDGQELREFTDTLPQGSTARLKSQEYYFRESITWSLISSKYFGARYSYKGFLFDVGGSSIFENSKDYSLEYLLAFLSTNIASTILKVLNPTMNCPIKDVKALPLIYERKYEEEIKKIVRENIDISKNDWDSFETSWDFIRHPILLNANLNPQQIEREQEKGFQVCNNLEEAYNHWEKISTERFNKIKSNEERINHIFNEIYDLSDETSDIVPDDSITIKIANKERDIKSLISYAVGCMFGRYSLDNDGLIFAGGTFDENNYNTFKADNDNIIPITDEAYFSDDIVERFKLFIKKAFGNNTFNENIDFIAEALGKKGTETSEETIRRYFLNDFYNDHIKVYQKAPIYWLLDSGKKNGFKALVYMHRYNENLIPKARLDYLHRVQTTYEKLLSDVNYKLTTDLSMTDKKEAKNRQADLNAKLNEIKEYDEKIAHIANQRISIDLDDGVKVNYEKFKDILAKIK